MLNPELATQPIILQPLIDSYAAANRTIAGKERDWVAGIDLS